MSDQQRSDRRSAGVVEPAASTGAKGDTATEPLTPSPPTPLNFPQSPPQSPTPTASYCQLLTL